MKIEQLPIIEFPKTPEEWELWFLGLAPIREITLEEAKEIYPDSSTGQ